MNEQQIVLLELGKALKSAGYSFTAPTPLTYGGYLARKRRDDAQPLVEAFGWNRPFRAGELEDRYVRWLENCELLDMVDSGHYRSRVRFSTLAGMIFAHSGYPTIQESSVFFGPDTYRFAQGIRHLAQSTPDFSPRTIIDIGTGTGAGGIYAAKVFPGAEHVVLADINSIALEFAQVNAALNDLSVQTTLSDILQGVEAKGDLIISNPPYLIDPAQRAYRHGGGDWGCDLAVRMVKAALDRLTDTGRLLLYTGTPVVNGVDKFLEAVRPVLNERLKRYGYEETDPDVFGEELKNAPYDQADRIATVILNVSATDIIR
jgi:hypothetical protein